MSTWYLGPPGNLRALVAPERDVQIKTVRYGGVHQGLSGSRTFDMLGMKTEVSMSFTLLEESDFQWLQALYSRHIPGPHRLISPLRKNRLSAQAASVNALPMVRQAIGLTSGSWEYVNSWPTAAGYGIRSLGWQDDRVSGASLQFDPGTLTAIHPVETVTASVFLRGASAISMTMVIDWYDAYGVALSSSTTESASVTTSWQRFSMARTAPTGAALCRFSISSTATTHVDVAAPQIEAGVLTAWDQGGGDLLVLIDQMPSSSPRFPLMDCSIVLLEA